MIPFAPPRIDQKIIDAVTEVLLSGWITTGPKTKEFEKRITSYTGSKASLGLNSATAGMEIMLRWFGVKEGDEVIVPAYTYAATANVVVHCGAKVVFVDVNPLDFNISVEAIKKAITPATKVIMPVDFGGLPCDYEAINKIAADPEIKKLFKARSPEQEKLGRILVLSDAAHSFGASRNGKRAGSLTDVSVFSFHAVKNLTTVEGGAVALNLPAPFDNEAIYAGLCVKILHGQNKDALAKTKKGGWKYDIVEAGYKCNLTDLVAAIGIVELERYDNDTLLKRKAICNRYAAGLKDKAWAQLPVLKEAVREASYHLFALRLKGVKEETRDAIMQEIMEAGVAVNVHFIPVPMMSFYKSLGYDIKNYPAAYDNYSREISLPVFYDLSDEDADLVISTVIKAVERHLS
jgi:dTDP-4-amino-4,6-dideoxygalactose transaminase